MQTFSHEKKFPINDYQAVYEIATQPKEIQEEIVERIEEGWCLMTPRAITEVVSNAIYHLERGLREWETLEAFVEYGNFTPAAGGSCNWPPNVWAKLKKNGTVGRDILKAYREGLAACTQEDEA